MPLEGWWDRTGTAITEALSKGMSTDHLYGEEFKSRKPIHRDIVDEYLELALQHPTGHKAVMLGGLPASGKSTFIEENYSDCAIVSPDFFKGVLIDRELVPDIETVTPLETGSLCHAESAWIAKQFFFELIELGINVAMDFTMNFPDSVVKRVKPLKANGYQTEMVLLKISKLESAKRTKKRHQIGVMSFLDGFGLGGRYVPDDYINGCTPVQCFNATKSLFHGYSIYDTSGEKPKLEKSW